MPAVRDPLLPLRAAAAAREAAGLRRALRPRGPGADGIIDLASNDYLGLSQDPQVVEGAVAAAQRWGTGATGSRLVTGDTGLHATLEKELAGFAGAQAALVFSSGYLANLAAVTALAAALDPGDGRSRPGGSQPRETRPDGSQPRETEPDGSQPRETRPGGSQPRETRPTRNQPRGTRPRGTLVVSDEANHASLIDACRLSAARIEIVGHRDVSAVDHALGCRREPAAIVVAESVFSVAGDLAPVGALHAVARAHGAVLMIDEAHAFGVLGPGGRGAAWAEGIAAEPDVVRTITLSKALAAQGGAVLGAAEVIETLINTGRSFIFDTALAPPAAGAALAALHVLAARPEIARRAAGHASRLADLALRHGLEASRPAAAVVSVLLGAPETAVAAQRIFAAHGVRAGCFRPPSVPAGRSCLRLTARASLSEADFGTVAQALAAVADHVRMAAPAGRN
jgi:7-keto-8-aminopelargonate synthetase-like enzyme